MEPPGRGPTAGIDFLHHKNRLPTPNAVQKCPASTAPRASVFARLREQEPLSARANRKSGHAALRGCRQSMGSPPRIARRSVVDAEPGVCVFTTPSVPNGVEEALPPGGTSAPQICNLDCQYPNLIHNLTIREPSNPPSGETVPVIAAERRNGPRNCRTCFESEPTFPVTTFLLAQLNQLRALAYTCTEIGD